MCKCDPNIRTPWCGKPGCTMPLQTKPLADVLPEFGGDEANSSVCADDVNLNKIMSNAAYVIDHQPDSYKEAVEWAQEMAKNVLYLAALRRTERIKKFGQ